MWGTIRHTAYVTLGPALIKAPAPGRRQRFIMSRPTHAFPNGRPPQNLNIARFESQWQHTHPPSSTNGTVAPLPGAGAGAGPRDDGGWGAPPDDKQIAMQGLVNSLKDAASNTASIAAAKTPLAQQQTLPHQSSPYQNTPAAPGPSALPNSSSGPLRGPMPGGINDIPVSRTRAWGISVNQDSVNDPGRFDNAQEKIEARKLHTDASFEHFGAKAEQRCDKRWDETTTAPSEAPSQLSARHGQSLPRTDVPNSKTGPGPYPRNISSSSGLYTGWQTDKGETLEEADLANDGIDRWWLERRRDPEPQTGKTIFVARIPHRSLQNDSEAVALLHATYGSFGTIVATKIIRSSLGLPRSAHVTFSKMEEAQACLASQPTMILPGGGVFSNHVELANVASKNVFVQIHNRRADLAADGAQSSLPAELIIDAVPRIKRNDELVWRAEVRPKDEDAVKRRNEAIMAAVGVPAEEVARVDCRPSISDREIIRKLCSMLGSLSCVSSVDKDGGWEVTYDSNFNATFAKFQIAIIPGMSAWWPSEWASRLRFNQPPAPVISTTAFAEDAVQTTAFRSSQQQQTDVTRPADSGGWGEPPYNEPSGAQAPPAVQKVSTPLAGTGWITSPPAQPSQAMSPRASSDLLPPDVASRTSLSGGTPAGPSNGLGLRTGATPGAGAESRWTSVSPAEPRPEPSRTVADDLEKHVYYKEDSRRQPPLGTRRQLVPGAAGTAAMATHAQGSSLGPYHSSSNVASQDRVVSPIAPTTTVTTTAPAASTAPRSAEATVAPSFPEQLLSAFTANAPVSIAKSALLLPELSSDKASQLGLMAHAFGVLLLGQVPAPSSPTETILRIVADLACKLKSRSELPQASAGAAVQPKPPSSGDGAPGQAMQMPVKQPTPKSFVTKSDGMMVAVYDDVELKAWRGNQAAQGSPMVNTPRPKVEVCDKAYMRDVTHVAPWAQQVQAAAKPGASEDVVSRPDQMSSSHAIEPQGSAHGWATSMVQFAPQPAPATAALPVARPAPASALPTADQHQLVPPAVQQYQGQLPLTAMTPTRQASDAARLHPSPTNADPANAMPIHHQSSQPPITEQPQQQPEDLLYGGW